MSNFLDAIFDEATADLDDDGEHSPTQGVEAETQFPESDPIDCSSPDFSDLPQLSTAFDRDSKGRLVANLNNAVLIVEHDPLYEGALYFDEFLRRPMTGSPAREWTNADDLNLNLHIQRSRSIPRIGLDVVSHAALTVAFRNRRNCVKDYMQSIVWDGVSRIEHFFEDHFNAPGTQYTRAASKNFWLSMVARVYRPGCQCDHMVVLEGHQGIGKSAALRAIGGPWFAEQHESAKAGKGFFEVLQGKLLVEISEMDAFSRADITRVKQVITCLSDRYRDPWGRHATDHLRTCVFAGTTNKDDWNRDETGARRFWPIACHGDIDITAINANRDQLFAEAVARYREGETWWQMPAEETRQEQASRYVAPAWVEPIKRYLEFETVFDSTGTRTISRNEPITELSIAEILEHALNIPRSQWSKANEMRAGESLRFLGWQKRDVRRDGRIVKRWLPPSVATTQQDAT